MTGKPVRVCVVGDELAAGVGDPKSLGWVGRVAARSYSERPLEVFTLAVPGENTTELAARWLDEVDRRTDPEIETRVVIAIGRADATGGLSLARSRLNLANILDVALDRGLDPLVVGPPPGLAAENTRLRELAVAFGDVSGRRRAPFIDLFAPLEHHEQWQSDLAATGTAMPQQAGYGLIAWLVLHYGWRTWLGLPADR